MKKKIKLYILIFVPIICIILLVCCFSIYKYLRKNVQYIGTPETISLPLEKLMYNYQGKPVEIGIWNLNVKVNGIKCRLILDTGSPVSVLSKEFCQKHSLTGKKVSPFVFRSNIEDDNLLKVYAPLEVGNIKLAQSLFYATNLEHITNNASPPPAGVLGADFLNQYIYSINMRDGILKIISEADYDNIAGDKVPIAIRVDQIYINLDIDKKPVEFVLDTGCSISEVNGDDFKHLTRMPRKHSAPGFDINSNYSSVSDTIELPDFKFGTSTIKTPLFSVSEEDVNLIGANLLKHFNIVINPVTKCMIITPNCPHPTNNKN